MIIWYYHYMRLADKLMIRVVASMFPIHFVNRIRRKARPKVTKKHETAIIMKLETSRKVIQVELRGHYNRQTIGRNYTISGSNDNQCEGDDRESLFEEIRSFNPFFHDGNIILPIQNPKFYLCYKIVLHNADNLALIKTKLWEYLPDLWESIRVQDIMKSRPDEALFAPRGVRLPYSLVIARFATPVYATNYTLRISANVVYRLEGKDDNQHKIAV